jgi:gas vesicle protein
LGAKNNIDEDLIDAGIYPEKLIIVAEPSFGSAIKFLLFGAAIGAGAAYYMANRNASGASTPETAAGTSTQRDEQLAERAKTLAKRVKNLAGHARDIATVVGTKVKPAIQTAVAEGKKAAQATQEAIKDELENEPDTIYAKDIADEQA